MRNLLAKMALVVVSISSVACVMPIDIAGGPRNANYRLQPEHIGAQLRPLVADEPEALTRIDQLERDERVSKVAQWSGFGLLGGCLAVSAADNANTTTVGHTTSDATRYTIIGLCGASIVSEVVSIIFVPTNHSWGDVLRVYNRRHPQTAWGSSALGVEAPIGSLQSSAFDFSPKASNQR